MKRFDFSVHMGELLQTAPTAISSVSACFAASMYPKAVLKLNPVAHKDFQYLK